MEVANEVHLQSNIHSQFKIFGLNGHFRFETKGMIINYEDRVDILSQFFHAGK